ncbi:MAG: YqgE/AlgH family protein [Gammaproteobacteria bacterium]|nr:YqgE/AlgH family protein [Gammaproteobacteria bacterium]
MSPSRDGRPLTAATASPAFTPMPVAKPAKGVFLVATQAMPDPRFWHSVILLLLHDETGTLGLIVNHPTDLRMDKVLPDLAQSVKWRYPLFYGGPVARDILLFLVGDRAFGEGLEPILPDRVFFSGDRTVLERLLAADPPPERLRLYLGHAGWAPQQLEAELARGGWRLFRADPTLLFHESPQSIWDLFLMQPGLMTFQQVPAEQRVRRSAQEDAAAQYSKDRVWVSSLDAVAPLP